MPGPSLTFLGTGGAFTDLRRNYHNNALLHTSDGNVLIDCGATAVQSLRELGLDVWDAAAVLVTHVHGDHVNGIEQLVWERFYGVHPDSSGGPAYRTTQLWSTPSLLEALERTLGDCLDAFTDVHGVGRTGGYAGMVQTRVLPSDGTPIPIGDTTVTLHRTPHVVGQFVDKECHGIEISRDGVSVYYTSDTILREDIGDRFPHARLIFHDCTFEPHYDATVHSHYDRLRALPPEVRARIALMHYTEVPDYVDVLADGFHSAAAKHDRYDVDSNGVVTVTTSPRPRPPAPR